MTGLDSETHNGKAVLICTPAQVLEPWRMRGQDRFLEICAWLRAIDKEGFCCWNADYDVQAILKWLPRSVGERLHRFSRARYKGYRLRWVQGKFFTVHKQKTRLVAIYDLMQFYACRLETAATKHLPEGEMKTDPGVAWNELFQAMKPRSPKRQQIIEYCRNDAKLVEMLYEKSRSHFERIGVKFDRPVSCAAIASQKFGKLFEHSVPKTINRAFEKTFRGGRMECLRVGFFPEAWLYDLHSAYPSVIAELPTIPTAWERIKNYVRDDARFAAVKAVLHVPKETRTGPLPVMGDGQLIYPTGRWMQWVDLETFRLMEERGMIAAVLGGYQAALGDWRYPFAEIREMYEERLKTPENAWALKICMNAWYGKLAQRMEKWGRTRVVGPGVDAWNGCFWRRKEQWTKKTCFVYASAITSGIRARMYREVDASKTIFYATDGVALIEPDPKMKTGPALGEWSEGERVTDLLVVGSGVYCYRQADGTVRTKFRGFDVGLDLYSLLDSPRRILEMSVKRNVTLAHALIQRKWSELNEIQDVPRYLDCQFDRKRRWSDSRTGRKLLNGQFESEPWRYYDAVEVEK